MFYTISANTLALEIWSDYSLKYILTLCVSYDILLMREVLIGNLKKYLN